MTLSKILYHPRFEPSEMWLRTMLLFYDTVYAIVPESAAHELSPNIEALNNKLTDAFKALTPSEQDLEYDWDSYDALKDVLSHLPRPSRNEIPAKASLELIEGMPRFELGDTVAVHYGKMADMLAQDLLELGLAQNSEDPKWLFVDRRVAGLILSMLADRMARNRDDIIGTGSDQDASFAVASRSELKHERSWNAEATLASAVLTAQVPDCIADLPLDRYLDVRKRYEDKRDVFRLAMHELQTLSFDQTLHKAGAYDKRIKAIVTGFSKEMETLRNQRLGNVVRKWAPVAIGGVVALASAAIASPLLAVGAAGVSLTLQVLQTSKGEQIQGTNIARAQSLLVQLERDLNWNTRWLGRVFSW